MNIEQLNVERDKMLKEELLDVLAFFNETIEDNNRLDIDAKVFIIQQTEKEVLHLLDLGIQIRKITNKMYHKEIRFDAVYSFLNIGGAISSNLWTWTILQNKVIDRIGYTYGLSFNTHKIYPLYMRNADHKEGYLLSAGNLEFVDRVSMAIDGQWTPLDKQQFLNEWSIVLRNM